MPPAPDEYSRDFLAGLVARVRAMAPAEALLARRAFRLLLEGRPAPRAALAGAEGLTAAEADAALARLVERGMLGLDPRSGTVVVARGLSLEETVHGLALGTRGLYASCAVDAVGIPAALGAAARVGSRCHACGTAVGLGLACGQVTDAPPGVVIWAPVFDASRPLRTHT